MYLFKTNTTEENLAKLRFLNHQFLMSRRSYRFWLKVGQFMLGVFTVQFGWMIVKIYLMVREAALGTVDLQMGDYLFGMLALAYGMICLIFKTREKGFLRKVRRSKKEQANLGAGELEFTDSKEDIYDVNWEKGTGTIDVTFSRNGNPYEFEADVMNDWISAVSCCRQQKPDLVILDIMLPGIDGYEVCKQIREFSHCPILFLSSKNDELDKILGLAVGGYDYVTKPFSPKEVVYRVKAQLRRTEYGQLPPKDQSVKVGALNIDPEGCLVRKNGEEIELTAREFEILEYLAQNTGRVVSRERLYENIWGEDSLGCDNTIMVHIRHLREKLEDNPTSPKYIITMKGLGYKLVDPYEK